MTPPTINLSLKEMVLRSCRQHFQVDPITAPAVLHAFKRYAEGASMQEVTDEMNIKGIRTKRGGKISINSVT